jgi:hypothetical protein
MNYRKYEHINSLILYNIWKQNKKDINCNYGDIAKLIKWEDKPIFMDKKETFRFYKKKSLVIRYHVKTLLSKGIIQYKQDGDNSLSLTNRVRVCRHKFFRNYSNFVGIRDNNNLWTINEV